LDRRIEYGGRSGGSFDQRIGETKRRDTAEIPDRLAVLQRDGDAFLQRHVPDFLEIRV
jgi:hypothetical protein